MLQLSLLLKVYIANGKRLGHDGMHWAFIMQWTPPPQYYLTIARYFTALTQWYSITPGTCTSVSFASDLQ